MLLLPQALPVGTPAGRCVSNHGSRRLLDGGMAPMPGLAPACSNAACARPRAPPPPPLPPQVSTETLLEFALDNPELQFIFLTPQVGLLAVRLLQVLRRSCAGSCCTRPNTRGCDSACPCQQRAVQLPRLRHRPAPGADARALPAFTPQDMQAVKDAQTHLEERVEQQLPEEYVKIRLMRPARR